MEDIKYDWVWSLKKGDKVWVALNENLTQAERFVIDFLEQTGVSEFEEVPEIFVPYEMEILDNWMLKGEQGESHIIRQIRKTDIQDCFSRCQMESIPKTRIFKTKQEAEEFCTSGITSKYNIEYCDTILAELKKIEKRVKAVRQILVAEENGESCARYSKAVENILD